MKKANLDIRQAIKKADIYQWQVADAIGISYYTFQVWLRHELSGDKKNEVLAAIETAKKGA